MYVVTVKMVLILFINNFPLKGHSRIGGIWAAKFLKIWAAKYLGYFSVSKISFYSKRNFVWNSVSVTLVKMSTNGAKLK